MLCAEQKVIKVGVVPQYDVRKIQNIWNPILAQLEKDTNLKFQLVPSSDIPAFETQFTKGEFDMVYLNPYHILIGEKAQGYKPILRDHGRKLFGILVINKESQIKNIQQLNGQEIVFPAPNALGASLLIRANLDKVHQVKIKPRYVKSHSSVYLNVATGAAVAGGGVQKTFKQQPKAVKNQMTILFETQKVHPHPIALHPRVSKKEAQTITKAFYSLNDRKSGKSMLLKIPIKKIGVAKMSDYTPLNRLGLEEYYKK